MKNEAFVINNNLYLTVKPFLELDDSLKVGFTTRKNGYSIKPYDSLNLGLHVKDNDQIVIDNREKLASELQIPLSQWVFSEQIHGNNIKKIEKKHGGRGSFTQESAIKDTDGMYTKDNNVLLASLYADCVPLYFWSKKDGIVGLAHAGWKGTVGLIGPKMIERWVKEENVDLQSIYVAIGPSISQENYEVDDFVINKVNEVMISRNELLYKQKSKNRYLLNLKELNKQLLIHSGIKEEQIFISDYCTFSEQQLFFSYRRQGQTGRMMSFIGRV